MASMINALLTNKVEVDVLCFNTVKHYHTEEEIVKHSPKGLDLQHVYLDNRVRPFPALLNLFTSSAFHVSRFKQSAFQRLLLQQLGEQSYDLIQLEGLSMAVYLPLIRKNSNARIVLRAHNVESIIWQRHLQVEKNPLLRNYLRLQNRRLAKFEKKTAYEVDAIVCITEEDLREFSLLQPGKVALSIPCGVNLEDYPQCSQKEKLYDLVYIASFDWLPNRQGIKWFLSDVWPKVLNQRPETTFRLGGRHMPQDIIDRESSQLKVEPVVDDMKAFICSGKLAVVPLLAGSGMRIKILENMALGLCQVTTDIGAEGIKLTNGEDIILANDPAEMADKIIALLDNPERSAAIGISARKNAGENYANKSLGKQLVEFYETEVCR